MKLLSAVLLLLSLTITCIAQTNVRILYDRKCQVRDGIQLSSDIYLPPEDGRYPVILIRTPYNKNGDKYLRQARFFTSKGYVVVCQDVRGRGDSEGVFVPYRNEGKDGYDAIEWCARQTWSNGKIGTLGGSYLGRVQWLAAVKNPPHLKTMIVLATPSDPFVEWPTGVPIPMHLSWLHYVSGHLNQNIKGVNWHQIYHHLPLLEMDDISGRPLAFWDNEINHPGLNDWWEPIRYQNKFDSIDVPVLHISGWYDDEQVGTPLNYMGMTKYAKSGKARRSQKLLIGPWPHAINSTSQLAAVNFGQSAIIDLEGYQQRWFDFWLKDDLNGIMNEAPVRIFVMGENTWRDENEWPLARTVYSKYFLHSGGQANSLYGNGILDKNPPQKEEIDTFNYNPANPVPFITDPEFSQIGSADDYQTIERRQDILVYTSAPMEKDFEICGPVKMILFAATDALDTDFTAKLLDVWPDGYAQRLCDGIVRGRFRNGMEGEEQLIPGEIYRFVIDMWNTSQVFFKGHRIRLEISSSAFPKYDRNPNTGDPLGQNANIKTARQTIFHQNRYNSHVVLPVIPR